jgi:hypothetical protein
MSKVWGDYDTAVGGMVWSGMHAEMREDRALPASRFDVCRADAQKGC